MLHVYGGDSGLAAYSGHTKLVVEDDSDAQLSIVGPARSAIYFGDADNEAVGYILYSHGTDYLAIGASNTERIRINNAGNVGIGVTDPSEALEVNGNLLMSGGDIKTDRWLNSDTNTFIGVEVAAAGNLSHSTGEEGWHNTAIGYQSLYSNTIGNSNTANGYRALYSNTTGYQNTASGYAALSSNTTGYQNAASGFTALGSNTIGNSNTANGTSALGTNIGGSRNTASGNAALYFNTSGGETLPEDIERFTLTLPETTTWAPDFGRFTLTPPAATTRPVVRKRSTMSIPRRLAKAKVT